MPKLHLKGVANLPACDAKIAGAASSLGVVPASNTKLIPRGSLQPQ
jgi:hypothetical protein